MIWSFLVIFSHLKSRVSVLHKNRIKITQWYLGLNHILWCNAPQPIHSKNSICPLVWQHCAGCLLWENDDAHNVHISLGHHWLFGARKEGTSLWLLAKKHHHSFKSATAWVFCCYPYEGKSQSARLLILFDEGLPETRKQIMFNLPKKWDSHFSLYKVNAIWNQQVFSTLS